EVLLQSGQRRDQRVVTGKRIARGRQFLQGGRDVVDHSVAHHAQAVVVVSADFHGAVFYVLAEDPMGEEMRTMRWICALSAGIFLTGCQTPEEQVLRR